MITTFEFMGLVSTQLGFQLDNIRVKSSSSVNANMLFFDSIECAHVACMGPIDQFMVKPTLTSLYAK